MGAFEKQWQHGRVHQQYFVNKMQKNKKIELQKKGMGGDSITSFHFAFPQLPFFLLILFFVLDWEGEHTLYMPLVATPLMGDPYSFDIDHSAITS